MSMILSQAVEVTDVEPLSVVVARNVRAEAARRGYTHGQLAEALGLARVAVTNRHGFHTRWTLDEVERLAALFDMPLDDLLARPRTLHQRTARAVRGETWHSGRDAEVFTFGRGLDGE